MRGERTPVQLGDLVSIKHGWPFKSELCLEELTGRPIVVSIGNFRYTGGFRFNETRNREYRGKYPSEYELKPGEILLAMTCQTPGGEILGIPARVPNDGRMYLHNQRLGKVVVKRPDLVASDYLYWLFLTAEFNRELCTSASGTKIVHTAPGRIEAFRFDLPPLGEQLAITSILNAVNDKIELTRQMNETLENMARALFQSWFVDFDPVRARMEGRHPFGMDAETAALFPCTFDASSFGPVPTGWIVNAIGNCTCVVGGGTPSTDNAVFWEGGDIHWVTPKDLSLLSNRALLSTERKVTKAGLQQISSGLLPKGTVLMSSRAPIGYFAISEVPVAINQGFIGMICDGLLPNHYVLNWAEANIATIVGRANGTTFLEISKASFRPIPVVVPPKPVLDRFCEQAEVLHCKMVNNLEQSKTLIALRDTLLPKLMSGEVRVRDAERTVEAAI